MLSICTYTLIAGISNRIWLKRCCWEFAIRSDDREFRLFLSRCIWQESTGETGAPPCFYSGSDGYSLNGDPQPTDYGYKLSLMLPSGRSSPYGEEFSQLTVEVIRVTNEKLRIKVQYCHAALFGSIDRTITTCFSFSNQIYPEGVTRFEVPWTHENPSTSATDTSARYRIDFITTNGGLFGVRVTRKSTGRVL